MKPRPRSLILGTALFALVMVGCTAAPPSPPTSETTPTGEPAPPSTVSFPLAEPLTVSAFAHSEPGQELDQTLFMATMQEKTNVNWDLTLASNAELEDKLGLSFNGGEYAEVYLKSGITEVQAASFAKQGIVIPLNDLIRDYMPNLTAALDDQGVWKTVTSADGNIYALPQLNGPGVAAPSVFINEPWLKAVGLDMPTTEAEFMAVLRAFRDQNPGNGGAEVYPLYLPAGAVDMMLPYFGIAMDPVTNSTYDKASGTLTYVPTSEAFKEFLRFMATAYSEKLINQNAFTATWDELAALGATKDVLGAFPHWGAYLVAGDRHMDFPMLMPFHPDSFPVNDGVAYGALAITDKAARPEVVAAWADTLYDEVGARLCWMGVEGKTYKLNADGTYTWLTDGQFGSDIATIRTQTLFGNQPAPCIKSTLFEEGQTDPFEKFLGGEREKIKAFGADPFPILTWTGPELTEKASLATDINSYVQQFEAQVITGEVDLDSGWATFVQTLQNMGLDRLEAIQKAAYDRWLEQNR